jgi:AraC family transcriptional activator of pobA
MNYFVKYFYYDHAKHDYAVPHNHKYFELVYYAGGTGSISLVGGNHAFRDGTVLLVAPGQAHDDISDKPTRVHCLQFDFPDDILETTVTERTEDNAAVNSQILERLNRMSALYSEKSLHTAEFEEHTKVILALLMKLLNLNNRQKFAGYKYTVDYIKEYLSRNCSNKINFEVLSNSIGYSCGRMRSIFRARTGTSIYQYLNGIRLSKAKGLLKDTDTSMLGIAKACGFSPIRFNLFFNERMKMSPGNYRKMMRAANSEIKVFNADTGK